MTYISNGSSIPGSPNNVSLTHPNTHSNPLTVQDISVADPTLVAYVTYEFDNEMRRVAGRKFGNL